MGVLTLTEEAGEMQAVQVGDGVDYLVVVAVLGWVDQRIRGYLAYAVQIDAHSERFELGEPVLDERRCGMTRGVVCKSADFVDFGVEVEPGVEGLVLAVAETFEAQAGSQQRQEQ